MLGLAMLAAPAAAQQIVIEELDKTQSINLLLTVVRVEIAAQNCPDVNVTEQQTTVLHDTLGALATKLEYSDDMLQTTFVDRAKGIYDTDSEVFCATWAPQVRPVAVALLED